MFVFDLEKNWKAVFDELLAFLRHFSSGNVGSYKPMLKRIHRYDDVDLLMLMEEILHHLACKKLCK